MHQMNMSKLLSNYVTESTLMLQPAYVGTTNTAELSRHSVVDTILVRCHPATDAVGRSP